MREKWFAASLFLAVASAPILEAAPESSWKYVAATYSDRFHRADCKVVRKIDKVDMVGFINPEDALAAGFVTCKKCNPPVSSKKTD